jgi:D-lactate dehydrogenase
MKIAVFSTKSYDREFLLKAREGSDQEFTFLEPRLNEATAALAHNHDAVCIFVNDVADAAVVQKLKSLGVRLIVLRCAGFNNVDLEAAAAAKIAVVRVPEYSPFSVAEHTVGLMLALNRRLYRAYNRVREGNFSLDGLLGFDMHGRTVGIVGTGKIGEVTAKILSGFGCNLLFHDIAINPNCEPIGDYVSKSELLAASDIVTLHCPLVPATHHFVDADAIDRMRPGAMLVNTSRGGLVDTQAVIQGLKSGKLGSLAIDVYEEEAALFFEDLSGKVIQDDTFSRLLTFPNVLITGHQAFFTGDAMQAIATTTLANITAFANGQPLANEVKQK